MHGLSCGSERNAPLWYPHLLFYSTARHCLYWNSSDLSLPQLHLQMIRREGLGYFFTTEYEGASFPHVAVSAGALLEPPTQCYLLSSAPHAHSGLARADSTALLIGSVSELLLQSRRGAQNTGFIPVRPIHYVLTPAPREPSGGFKRSTVNSFRPIILH